MKKSLLERRSSTHIPVRVPSIGGASVQKGSSKTWTNKLREPGFSSQKPRAQSEGGGRAMGSCPDPLRHSSSHTSMRGDITPRQTTHNDPRSPSQQSPIEHCR